MQQPALIKELNRGYSVGELLAGIVAAQLAGKDFLAGLDRVRADAAGQQLTPVPGLSSTTAAGLARRITPGQWEAIETGVAAVTERVLTLLPPEQARELADGPVTIDLDATDVEVYGRKKGGVAYNHQGRSTSARRAECIVNAAWSGRGAHRGRLAGCRQVRGVASRPGSRRHWRRDQCLV